MLDTAKIVDSFRAAPQEMSLDEAVERLVILDRYERAMQEMSESKGHTNETVMREMKEWIQASR